MATSGTIARLVGDRGFGLIRDEGGQELFFHAKIAANPCSNQPCKTTLVQLAMPFTRTWPVAGIAD